MSDFEEERISAISKIVDEKIRKGQLPKRESARRSYILSTLLAEQAFSNMLVRGESRTVGFRGPVESE